MPEEPASPSPTPANYQRTTGGHLRWQPPTPEHLQTLLPAYEILSIIGKGGMGAVYQGRQKSLDRLVAIKLLPPEAADNDMEFVARFKNEARTMAKMNHPAIVHVYDFGETSDGQLYIVMEYIDGTDVAKMIQSQGKLPPEHALAISAHVCDALQYAHTHGVVHRDIKPANILLTMEGQVKVADFGLAKTADTSQAGLTKTNMAMGTPDFVAPETLTPGMNVDGRADLYAVGVMLYNMLTGQVPRGAFRMPSVTSATDMRYDKIIGKAMEMDRELRYQTALDVRRDLDVILTTPLAKPGERTISVKPRDLPQKLVGKSPSTPQQQHAPGSSGVPLRTSQPPPSGPAAKPASPPAKTGQSDQTPAEPPQKSSAGIYYGIAAVAVIAAVALLMFPGAGEKTEPKPGAQTAQEKPKPDPKPPATPKPTDATPQTSAVLPFASHRYQFIASKDSWTEAKDKALAMGGHLVTITSKEEDEFISKTFHGNLAKDNDFIFIGGIASPTPNWTWVTGEDFTYKPSLSSKTGEMRMLSLERAGGKLRWKAEEPSTRRQGFLVEWDDDGKAPPTTPALTFAGHRYQLVTDKLKWDAAMGMAASMGGHLATITTKEENEWVVKNITTQLKKTAGDGSNWDRFYIGAIQRKAPDGPWEWITGEPFSLQSWMGRFPNDKNNSVKVATLQSKTWDDVAQNYEALSFLVEWDDAAPAKPAPLALTGPVNLLAFVDVKRDAVYGDWTLSAEGLMLKQASGMKLLGFNQDLPDEYDFEIEFTPTQGKREVIQVLPVLGGTALHWRMGLGKEDPPLFAFGPVLDGKNPEDPKRSEAVVKHPRLAADHRYRSTVEVRKGSLRALLDGKEVLKWSGDFKRFPMEKSTALKLRDPSQAGVGGHDSGIIFHKAELRPPSAAPVVTEVIKPAKPTAKAPPMPVPVPAEPAPPADPRLAQLDAGYQTRYESDAQKPFLAAVTALNQSYVANGIVRARAAAKAKGSLAEVNALDAEKTAIETGGGVPAADAANAPESIKTLRSTYRTVLAKLTDERDARAAPLLQLYLGALDVYVADLTKADKIAEARKVQALRDAKAKQATATPAETTAATPQGTAAGNGLTNSLGMKFVPVKGTDVLFCIHETRRQDYTAFAADNPSLDGAWKNANRNGVPVGDKDDHPVVSVSWDHAHQFCEWLSKKEGRTYRLPTDEEWSMAVGIGHQESRLKESTPESLRFGVKDEYPWGGNFPPKTKDKAGNYNDISCGEKFKTKSHLTDYDDGFATTAPVMSFKPNKLGIYDLGGNADEWVEDWWNTSQKERATRGLQWLQGGSNMNQEMLSSFRGHLVPEKRDNTTGFRVVLEAPKSAASK